ncbi:hypothetical protein ACHAXS_001319 [Conticribra weissflogii]
MQGKNRPDVPAVILIYVNTILVDWHLKLQAMIETGVFGVEFAAMKTEVNTLRDLKYTENDGCCHRQCYTHIWGQHIHHEE